MTGFLASVRSLEEARTVAEAGADIIDLKAPDRGSLGALSLEEIALVTAAMRECKPISATVGDLPMEPEQVAAAVAATFDTGVDYVKVGLYPGGDEAGTIRRLRTLAERGKRLIAVVFADRNPPLHAPAELAAAGFTGCMLDTLDKTRGSLTEVCPPPQLQRFVDEVHEAGLVCGLAGSLTAADVATLMPMKPDYLGFRGALCCGGRRTDRLDESRIRQIAALFRKTGACLRATPAGHVPDPVSQSFAHDPLEFV